jgi:ABC-type glutathione transport system ATPase component
MVRASDGTDLRRGPGVPSVHGEAQGVVRAVDEVDPDVSASEMVAVMGPSGCGKSTLLHLLGGLERPTAGQVWLAGQRIDTLSERALARMRRVILMRDGAFVGRTGPAGGSAGRRAPLTGLDG